MSRIDGHVSTIVSNNSIEDDENNFRDNDSIFGEDNILKESLKLYLGVRNYDILFNIFSELDGNKNGYISASKINLDGMSIDSLESLELFLFKVYNNFDKVIYFVDFVCILLENKIHTEIIKTTIMEHNLDVQI